MFLLDDCDKSLIFWIEMYFIGSGLRNAKLLFAYFRSVESTLEVIYLPFTYQYHVAE